MTQPFAISTVASILLVLASPTLRAAEPGVFSIADFGAKPDTDSRRAIQSAFDAAAAYAESSRLHSAIVKIPLQQFTVSGPIYRDSQRVSIVGGGVGSVLSNVVGYGGPILVDGLKRLTRAEALLHRPPATALDATARADRLALATRGTHALIVNEHPFQLGGRPPGVSVCRADYFQQDHYTIECLLVKPPDVKLANGAFLFGEQRGSDPAPYVLIKMDTGFALMVMQEEGEREVIFITTPGLAPGAEDQGPWRICLQLDLKAGACSVWINNRAAKTAGKLRPNVKLKAPDGAHPWVFGSLKGDIPFGPGSVTNIELHGFMISAGAKYVVGRPSQARLDGTPVTDSTRYFTPTTTGDVQTAAWFPLTDPGGTQVRLGSQLAAGAGFWIAGDRLISSSDLTMQDVTIYSGEQAAILLGESWGSHYTRVRAGSTASFAGLASIGAMIYPVILTECQFQGAETGCYLNQTICHAKNCAFTHVGRTGMLVCGGSATLEGTFVSFMGPDCESFLSFMGMGAGSVFRVTDSIFDNEAAAPKDTAIRYEQVSHASNRLVIDGLESPIPGPNGLIHLIGFGLDAEQWGPGGPTWSPLKLEIKNIGRTRGYAPILRIDGPPGWVFGTFDASEQPTGTILGTGGTKVTVIPPAFPAPTAKQPRH